MWIHFSKDYFEGMLRHWSDSDPFKVCDTNVGNYCIVFEQHVSYFYFPIINYNEDDGAID